MLIVNDGELDSDTDKGSIFADTPNVWPNADAGPDQSAFVRDAVALDGSASDDPDNGPQPLSYLWFFSGMPSGSGSTLNTPMAINSSFSPDIAGEYRVTLEVSDGEAADVDEMLITAFEPNVPPNADAGTDLELLLGDIAYLDGTASNDPDMGPGALQYLWRFVSVPAASSLGNDEIFDEALPNARFMPDVAGDYVLALDVSDGEDSDSDQVAVMVTEEPQDDQPPVVSLLVVRPEPVATGTVFTVSASADDRDTGDSNIVSAELRIDDSAATPMTALDGAFDAPFEELGANVVADQAVGLRRICVTAADAADNVSGESCTDFIVYTIEAGKVNGGGWIDVEPGACALSPDCADAAGKVTFGLTAQFTFRDGVPTGNVQFQFRNADLNFHAEQIDGLVVIQPTAVISGYGRVNGESGYRFIVEVTDGDQNGSADDRIGIDIFATDGERVFRSSGLDSPLTTLPLQGGSLKVDCAGGSMSCGIQDYAELIP